MTWIRPRLGPLAAFAAVALATSAALAPRAASAAGAPAAAPAGGAAADRVDIEIPAFARKYGVSCTLCHAPAPRLTAFGETFAGNGFEFVTGETPRDTMDTGDPLLRLHEGFPLAVRFDAYIQAIAPEPGDRAAYDLQTPWGIKVLSGGVIAPRVSYYLYFFLSERGEIAGLEDAYLQFTDLFGSEADLIVGQFQLSDPMFKRELRLEVLDYAAYRVRVGDARADLTYDRGLMLSNPLLGGDLVLMLVNGQGLAAASDLRVYDADRYKNVAGHFSRDFGLLRLGLFGYYGVEEGPTGENDEILQWGPDATIPLGAKAELNLQYLRRTDSNPAFLPVEPADAATVDAAFAEVVMWPQGPAGRLFLTALYNHVVSADGLFSVRLGEAAALDRYRVGSVGLSYLLARNLRGIAEVGYDLEGDDARFTIGAMAAF
ncbi:MAG TPA: hypothetical protein VMM12_09105 [Longimicrobiales bacterium]|nr:hypothetical protein [Longimicrobiales bacterium]